MSSAGRYVDAVFNVAITTPIEVFHQLLVPRESGVTPFEASTAEHISEEITGAWEIVDKRRRKSKRQTKYPKRDGSSKGSSWLN